MVQVTGGHPQKSPQTSSPPQTKAVGRVRILLHLQRPRLVVRVSTKAHPRRRQDTQAQCLPARVSQADAGRLQDPIHDAGDSGSCCEYMKTVAAARVCVHGRPKEAHRTAHGQTPSVAVRTLDRRHLVAVDTDLSIARSGSARVPHPPLRPFAWGVARVGIQPDGRARPNVLL